MAFTLKRNTLAEDSLQVSTEEVAHWIVDNLPDDPDAIAIKEAKDAAEAFWQHIQTGVLLCKLAEKCSPATNWPSGAAAPVPDVKCPHNDKAKPGSFHARENVTHFLEACKQIGVPAVSFFTPDDVVNAKNKKQVVNCLLQLARKGAENGVTPPLIVQYELEIDAYEVKDAADVDNGQYDEPAGTTPPRTPVAGDDNKYGTLTSAVVSPSLTEEDEEEEDFVAAQYGLTEEQLAEFAAIFKKLDTLHARIVAKGDMIAALAESDVIKQCLSQDEKFAKHFTNAQTRASDDPNKAMDLGDFLLWFASVKRSGSELQAALSSLHAPKTRPRGISHAAPEHKYLPYIPKTGDEIDEALAEIVNEYNLDVRIRRVAITKKKKKHAHRIQGCYRVGDGDSKVYMRIIRDMLMVRSGSQWEGIVRFLQKMLE